MSAIREEGPKIRKRWTDFTPAEKSAELKSLMQSNYWKHLPPQVREKLLSLLAEYTGDYTRR